MNGGLLPLILICFIGMVSPGPDFLLVTKNALIYPKRQALATAFGIVSGCLFHASYCLLGLAFFITQSVAVYTLVKYAGACYLIYLGFKGLSTKHMATTSAVVSQGDSGSVLRAYAEGALCNVLNPKLAFFLLSLFTQFVSVNAPFRDKALVAGVFVAESALYWPLLVLVLQSHHIRPLFAHFQMFLSRLFGGLLMYLGVRVILSTNT